jgi:hypothetical protein
MKVYIVPILRNEVIGEIQGFLFSAFYNSFRLFCPLIDHKQYI